MKRGDIFWAELNPRSGSEQKGKRPVVIISHDGFNETLSWRSIIVIPITSSPRAKKGPTAIFMRKSKAGLTRDSIALCHQITTLDRAKLTKKIGTISPELLAKIEEGLLIAVDVH